MSVRRLPSGRWQARWGQSTVGTYATKYDAQQAEARARLGQGLPVAGGSRPTVETFAEAWRVTLLHSPLTASNVAATLRNHVYPVLGTLRLDAVTHLVAQGFVTGLHTSDLAPTTARKVETLARQLFRAAEDAGEVQVSPFKRVRSPRLTGTQRRRQGEHVPTAAEVLRMTDLARADGRADVAALVVLAAGTGLRGGELVGLTADEIDYPGPSVLAVRHQLQRSPEHGWFLAPPKTSAGVREVPLAQVVVDALAILGATREPLTATLPGVERGARRGERVVRLLVPATYGAEPQHESVLDRAVRALGERAGLPGRVTLHSLRKTYTTLLGDAGVPLKVIDAVTGHESSGLTLGVYTSVTAEGIERARQATQDALAPTREGDARALVAI